MAIQQFTTYDIIVDTLPGTFLLFLTMLLLPQEILTAISGSVAAAGVTILGGGYIIGRLIHTVGPGFEDINIPSRSDTDNDLAWLVVMELTDRMVVKSESVDEDDHYKGKLDFLDDNTDDVVSYGQSLLYGKNTLYTRYEMLSTFFRNMYYIFILLTALYFVRGTGGWFFSANSIAVGDFSSAFPWWSYLLGSLVGPILIWISRDGWQTFLDRKSRAFIHDIHHHLDLKEESPPEEY